MTLDEAKFTLNAKVFEIKKLLRNRKLEINTKKRSVFEFNGFTEAKEMYSRVVDELYREVKMLIGYIYMHELDELKRKKLAMYFVMQYSFSDFKNDMNYEDVYTNLDPRQKLMLEDFQTMQENIRKEVVRDLKNEYFSLEEQSPFDLLKIKWNGTRKQLAELFVELEQKNWIEFSEGERKPICNTIAQTFVINETNKTEEINVSSFYTTFRPDPNLKPSKYPYTSRYDKIFTPNYPISFIDIKPNK